MKLPEGRIQHKNTEKLELRKKSTDTNLSNMKNILVIIIIMSHKECQNSQVTCGVILYVKMTVEHK